MNSSAKYSILVVNGSPKGKYSVTVHTCLYLQKQFPTYNFDYLNAAQCIRSLEKDFTPALEAMQKADLILFSYPVYTFLVPSQLHRFIELMKASGMDFSGKIATQLTTSKHFYDITAHRFIEDNCADMGIPFLDGLSADMEDILTPAGQKQACDWFQLTMWNAEHGYFKPSDVTPVLSGEQGLKCEQDLHALQVAVVHPEPSDVTTTQRSISASAPKNPAKKAIIVADITPADTRLKAMVDAFTAAFPYECDVVNIEDFPFLGGCISCFNCSGTGKCFYKDGFDEYLRGFIHKHDAIIYAFRIQDHSMGYRFKMYDDRQFCNGHRTVTMGTPFGYIVDGEYSAEHNLRLVLEARAQVGGNFLAGVATNETSIQRLSDTVVYAMEHNICPPQNFLGVGGMKIFRDLIYQMRGMMRADHKFFKSHGQYDFPQKKWKQSMMMYLVGYLMGNKKLKAKMGNKLNEGMIAPYKKILEGTAAQHKR